MVAFLVPSAEGLKLTTKVVDCPGLIVSGKVIPLMEKSLAWVPKIVKAPALRYKSPPVPPVFWMVKV